MNDEGQLGVVGFWESTSDFEGGVVGWGGRVPPGAIWLPGSDGEVRWQSCFEGDKDQV